MKMKLALFTNVIPSSNKSSITVIVL